jgi:formate-dependent nitrite reductase membrane component NrfD
VTGFPSSTWFTAAPHWRWYIILYFFLGGLAAGSYFIAVMIDFLGRQEDRPLARLGYYIAFPLVLVSGVLLTVDLGKPLRFWHMLIENHTLQPMLKPWSPMSLGSWALMVFGLFTFLSFLAAIAEEDEQRLTWRSLRRIRWPVFRAVRARSALGYVLGFMGGIAGFFIAGYTGILLAVTNRPIWSDTPLLGMLFVTSAASTSAALLILLAHRWGWTMPGVRSLHRMDDWVILLELAVLIAVLVSLGPVLVAWLNAWGVLLLVTAVFGLIVPLILSWQSRSLARVNVATPAILVLIGGFLLRVVIILSSEAI